MVGPELPDYSAVPTMDLILILASLAEHPEDRDHFKAVQEILKTRPPITV